MKTFTLPLVIFLMFAASTKSVAQNVAINATGSNADASAMLDVRSTTSGFLMPRMTTAEQNAITLPANGLTIYNTNLNTIMINTGSAISPVWTPLSAGSIDTSSIANFSTKVRSLIKGSAPITFINGTVGITQAGSLSNGYLSSSDWSAFNSKGTGSVTTVSVVSANGVSGSVATPTTTPAITLILGAITPSSIAASGTITGSNLSGTNTGNVTIGTANGLSLSGQALSLGLASTSASGALSSTDWNTFNNKLTSVDTTNIANFSTKVRSLFSSTAPVTYSNGLIGITKAGASSNGYLSSADWIKFNNKSDSSTSWSILGNTGTNSGINYLGTTDNTSLRFKTNGTLGMVLDNLQNVGIGTATPTAALNVVKSSPGGLMVLQNTNAAGYSSADFLTHTGALAGTFGYGNTSANGPFAGKAYFNSYGNDFTLVNGSTSMMYLKASNNFVGIGTTAPAYQLQVLGTNPLSLLGVQLGTNTSADSVLTITGGVVKKLPASTFAASTAAISSLNGLTATTQTFATVNSGTDFNIVSSGSAHTFNIPDASLTASRGLITNGAQTIAGNKILSGNTSIGGTLGVTGASTLSGNTTVGGTLGVTGAITASTLGSGASTDSIVTANASGVLRKRKVSDILTGTIDTTNIANFSTKVRSLFSSTSPITYGNGLIGITQASTSTAGYLSSTDWNTFNNKADAANTWILGGNAVASAQNLGTTTANDLPFITSGTEKMRLTTVGKLGFGTANPSAFLQLKQGTAGATSAPLKFVSGALMILPEVGAVEFFTDNFYGTITSGTSRKEFTLNDIPLTSGRVPFANANGRLTDLAAFSYSTNRLSPTYISLAAGTATAGTAPLIMTAGVNLTTPLAGAVEFDGSHFYGTVGSTRYQLDQQVSNAWSITGNAGTNYTNYLGTSDNQSVRFKANSIQGLIVDSLGSVGVGLSPSFMSGNDRELLLVDGGSSTATNTLINAVGTNNDYLQMNVQNLSNGGWASSDVVATANNGSLGTVYIDMGINSQLYNNGTGNILNGSNTAYLYATGKDFYIGNGANNKDLIFFTNSSGTTGPNGTERARVTSSAFQPGSTSAYSLGTSSKLWTAVYAINGTIQTSDVRLKTHIHKLTYGLKEIMALKPVRYNWKTNPDSDNKIGLIAQDVRKVVPEVVVGDESKENIGMNYAELVPVLINAIKEQQQQIDDLKKEVDLLKTKK